MQGTGAEHDAHGRDTGVGPALGTGLQVRWSLEDSQVSVAWTAGTVTTRMTHGVV